MLPESTENGWGSWHPSSWAARLLLFAILAAVTTLLCAASVAAREGERSFSVGLWLYGGVSTYAMDDFNAGVDETNEEIREEWGCPDVTCQYVEGGGTAAGGLRMIYEDRLLLSLDYERLFGSTEAGGLLRRVETSVPADAILLTAGIDLWADPSKKLGLSAGIGRYSAAGEVQYFENDERVSHAEFDGAGFGHHYLVFFETRLSEKTHAVLMSGYRRAKVASEIEGETGDLDWSGFTGRIGMSYDLGSF